MWYPVLTLSFRRVTRLRSRIMLQTAEAQVPDIFDLVQVTCPITGEAVLYTTARLPC
jgi:hypothetical protein